MKVKTIFLAVAIALVVSGCVIAAGCTTAQTTPVVEQTPIPIQAVATPTPTPTVAPTVTPTVAPTVTPISTNPKYAFKLEILDSITDQKTVKEEMVKISGDKYIPSIGNDGYLAKIKLTYLPRKQDPAYVTPSLSELKVIPETFGDPTYSMPKSLTLSEEYPLIETANLSSGESITGWVYYIIPSDVPFRLGYDDDKNTYLKSNIPLNIGKNKWMDNY